MSACTAFLAGITAVNVVVTISNVRVIRASRRLARESLARLEARREAALREMGKPLGGWPR